jgi:hypothetical protein
LLANGKVLVAGGFGDRASINSAELYDPATNTWTRTGSLNIARSRHVAALLASGQVLVAGAASGDQSAELYDPDTGMWSLTSPLQTSGSPDTATLLPDGRVLVTGFGGTAAALYDPATDGWSLTTPPNPFGAWHAATLLASGEVLIAGGTDFTNSKHGVQIYDPRTDVWSPAGDLLAGRALHTATLLANGKVLIAGGAQGDFNSFVDVLNTAEMNDAGGPVAVPMITSASVAGKKLFLQGENFAPGAVILLKGKEQKTKNDALFPEAALFSKKVGRKIRPGDTLQVRNPDGTTSEEFTFTGF